MQTLIAHIKIDDFKAWKTRRSSCRGSFLPHGGAEPELRGLGSGDLRLHVRVRSRGRALPRDAGSASAFNCTCAPGHAALAAGAPYAEGLAIDECVPCSPGSFKEHLRNVACEPCATGFYQLTIVSVSCDECAADRFVRADGACVPCGAHEEASARSSTLAACTCAGGFARAALAMRGFAIVDEDNGDGDGDGDGDPDCRACPPGFFRSVEDSDLACIACPAGHVAAGTAIDDCSPCCLGEYAAATVNGSFCRQRTQHANSSELSVGIDSCLCAAGYFRAEESWEAGPTIEHAEAIEAGLPCLPCASGMFKTTPGNQACTRCPEGTTGASVSAPQVDAASCAPCSPNTYSELQYSPDAHADLFACVACLRVCCDRQPVRGVCAGQVQARGREHALLALRNQRLRFWLRLRVHAVSGQHHNSTGGGREQLSVRLQAGLRARVRRARRPRGLVCTLDARVLLRRPRGRHLRRLRCACFPVAARSDRGQSLRGVSSEVPGREPCPGRRRLRPLRGPAASFDEPHDPRRTRDGHGLQPRDPDLAALAFAERIGGPCQLRVPAKWLRRPTPTENSARCDPESLGFSLYKMHSL
jgi:hypothetical protein